MNIKDREFGVTPDGEVVGEVTLTNDKGAYVKILSYGATIKNIVVPDKDGNPTDVVLGYDTLEEYMNNDGYMGAVIGRFANRIGGGDLFINGEKYPLAKNNAGNHLHGGIKGFDKRVFDYRISDDSVEFSLYSNDGEEGYPGDLVFAVTYAFTNENVLKITYTARSNKDTVVNFTNHTYFNLNGCGDILNHRLTLYANEYTPADRDCLPTGKIESVKGTALDFTEMKPIGRDIAEDFAHLKEYKGYDHNFIIEGPDIMNITAECYAPESGITLTCHTTQPGVQLYTANFLTERKGKNGAVYAPRSGFCLETQHFPNSPAVRHFASPFLKKGDVFFSSTEFRFGIK